MNAHTPPQPQTPERALRCALVGMPGAGKSTVGRQLAQRMGVPFVDLDHHLEKQLGCSIRQFFEAEGEERFRTLESEALADIAQRPGGMVLSTGGGAVLRPENRDCLRRFGAVMYLRASPDDIFRRIRHDKTRPLLQVAQPLERLRELYAQRDPLYRQTAHYVIETGRPSVGTLVNMIVMQLDLAGLTTQAAP